MKLIWVHIQDDDCNGIMEQLKACGYRATLISSTEDFLNYGETTFLIGVNDQQAESVRTLIEDYYKDDKAFGNRKDKVFMYVLHASMEEIAIYQKRNQKC